MNPDIAGKEFLAEYNQITNRLRAYLRQLLPTRFDADEVLQETSIVLWNKFHEFEPGTNFLAWACRVAHFQVLTYRRTKARDRHLFSESLFEILSDEANEAVESHDSRYTALTICFKQLSKKYQNLLIDIYYKREKIKDVAEVSGVSPTALYKVLSRLRFKLRECIEKKHCHETH